MARPAPAPIACRTGTSNRHPTGRSGLYRAGASGGFRAGRFHRYRPAPPIASRPAPAPGTAPARPAPAGDQGRPGGRRTLNQEVSAARPGTAHRRLSAPPVERTAGRAHRRSSGSPAGRTGGSAHRRTASAKRRRSSAMAPGIRVKRTAWSRTSIGLDPAATPRRPAERPRNRLIFRFAAGRSLAA
jgi:hypothetical protein